MERTIKEVYDLIVEKRDNAEKDVKVNGIKGNEYIAAQLDAYDDVLCLLESSHLLDEDKPSKGSGLVH